MYGNRNISDLSSLLDAVEDRQREAWRSEHLTVENILDRMGQRAHGPLLLAMGLLSVSPATLVPGATWLLAAMTFVVAVQLFMHRPRTWMPRKALRVKVSHARLASFVRAARPAAMAVDKVVRPRWRFFLEPPFVSLVALMCAVAALITFPLGLVPLAPLVPGLAIVFFGLGLTARDGLLLALGLVVVSAGVVLILVA